MMKLGNHSKKIVTRENILSINILMFRQIHVHHTDYYRDVKRVFNDDGITFKFNL